MSVPPRSSPRGGTLNTRPCRANKAPSARTLAKARSASRRPNSCRIASTGADRPGIHAYHQKRLRHRSIVEWEIHLGPRRALRPLPHVLNHPDDLGRPRRPCLCWPKVPTHGNMPWPVAPGHRAIDHHDLPLTGLVGPREPTPLNHRASRRAPSAIRNAISGCRVMPRASIIPATFWAASTSNVQPAASNAETRRAGRPPSSVASGDDQRVLYGSRVGSAATICRAAASSSVN